ncbi:MAG: beta-ketoacyl-ACP synthase [Spirochaetaceae bacterium]|jgi:3-oxoacyl-[acyl-carrier-protein] synthase II|nr:beta-ketoacyl-ACP synthase [Spirochaetaceae bacterium]
MKKRVVITGGGVVSALGSEWQTILAKLKARKNCVRRMDEWDKYQQMNTRLAAPVDFEIPDYPRKKIRSMGRVALLSLAATEKALAMASLTDSPELARGRCGVAYGSSMGNIDSLLGFYSMLILNNVKEMTATTYIKSMPHTCAANIEVFYGLTGRIITTNTACTSGSMSLGYAYETIQNGVQDLMIAGGADELSAADAAIFDTLFAASVKNDTPGLTPAAYDAKRDGLVIGEGAGTMILEEYDHAINRGARIYAELVGFGTNTDGTHITKPNRATMGGAMTLALKDAGLCPADIVYVNTHGTGTTAGDIAETWATFDVFRRPVPVSTLKNYIGHTLGACGAIEAWVSVNMMNEGWFLPNINVTEIDPQCAPLDYILGEGRELEAEYIMSNNFAFGGINTSLIFKKIR